MFISVQDINATLFEFKKLRELSDRLKDETNAKEIGWQALSQEHNSMLDKVDQLECALKEQKMLISEKQQALDMNQVQLRGVTSKLQDIEHLLQAQVDVFPCLSSLVLIYQKNIWCLKTASLLRFSHLYSKFITIVDEHLLQLAPLLIALVSRLLNLIAPLRNRLRRRNL